MGEIDVSSIDSWSLNPDENTEFQGMSVKERSDPGNPANEHVRNLMAYIKAVYENGGSGGSGGGSANYKTIKNSDIDKLFVQTP